MANIDWEEVEKRLKQAMVAAYRASHRGEGPHWDNSPAPTPGVKRSLTLMQKIKEKIKWQYI